MTEKEIQQFLWNNRANWAEIIDPLKLPPHYRFAADLSDISPKKLLYNRLLDELSETYNFVKYMDLIGYEVPLEKKSEPIIRADLLGAYPGRPGIAVIELKKGTRSERESFTELLAYSNHLLNLFPTACNRDIVLILVAPMNSRIVREALLHSILFTGQRAFALVPYFTSSQGENSSLRLRPWIPDLDALARLTQATFNPKNFNVFKTVWSHTPGWWNPNSGQQITGEMRAQMDQVSALAAQELESKGIHGFVFSSQLWPELATALPYTNSLVLVGWNPYTIAHDLFLLEKGVRQKDLSIPLDIGPNLADVVQGLLKNAGNVHAQHNYLVDLSSVWDTHLARIGLEVVERCVQTTDDEGPSIDRGSMTWEEYQHQFLEDISCTNFTVRPTGLLRHLYWAVTKLDYAVAANTGVEAHPIHGDMFHLAVDALGSQLFFRKFLSRMFFGEVHD